VVSFGEPDLRGGHRENAMPERRGRRIVNLPISPLEPPVDSRRESKTQWQERKDRSDQSIVFENNVSTIVDVVAAVAAVAGAGSYHPSGLFSGASWRIHFCCLVDLLRYVS
jgi:hypothetical protein